ncbi:unnamed protein product [Clonostachys rosea]|uniref:Helicase-associated domain-containing protein n=1 Tax=Bionectria ochroleuca TaxID=29856 RepID=A0ABY6UNR0_BIOOC|nr:unnamed protein product [Clonostachys rosea]
MLELRNISQASATQRAGRAGRTRKGFYYRLYTKESFDFMEPTTPPAIRRENVDSLVLKLVDAGYRKIVDFDWTDAPHPESLLRAVQDLNGWGFLEDDGKITRSGRLAAKCPLSPAWYRAIEIGADLGCSTEIVDIAISCSSQNSIFVRPPEALINVAEAARGAFMHPMSDHITLLNAFNAYMHTRRMLEGEEDLETALRHWCMVNFLSMEALEEVHLARRTSNTKIKAFYALATNELSIAKTLATAFFTHIAIHHTDADHEWVVYTSLLLSGGKQYLQQATAISAELLVDLPFFRYARLPKRSNGMFRQNNVKEALERARSSTQADNGVN